ncbi:MAG: deoxyribose-phosphate aldolase [Lachnospiraceae bacterium]|nr:deoxyribose-phosphate aldolase [Lachnospiraceae bacterium]
MDLKTITKEEFGKYFELLTLKANTEEEVRSFCRLAKDYNMRSYMISWYWVPLLKEEFAGTDIKAGTGASFPFGSDPPKAKEETIRNAVKLGADTLDLSMNYSILKAGRKDVVAEELDRFVDAAEDREKKVIIEVAALTDDEIKLAIELLAERDINWVKTSTGQLAGPTMPQMKIIREAVKGTNLRIKVSGVKAPRPQNAYAYFKAGAEIIGSQGAPEIIDSLDLHRELGLI